MSHPNQSTALADSVIDELGRSGVSTFVIAPGSRSAALAIAVARRPDVSYFVEIDERSAGFFALGFAKATGVPAAVIVTSGTAVANLYPAVIEAEASGTPLLLLTADRPFELQDVGANQTIDQRDMFGRHVRWWATLGPDEDQPLSGQVWRSTVNRAVAETRGWSSRGGPVHLNLAFREPLVPRTDDGRRTGRVFISDVAGRSDHPWVRSRLPEVRPVPLDDRWVSEERGVVVAGAADRPLAGQADRLAAALGWPLIVEPSAGHRPDQTVTTAHHLAQSTAFAKRFRPDVVLTLGSVGLSRPLQAFLDGVPTVATMGWNDPSRSALEVHRGLVSVRSVPDRIGDWRRGWLTLERVARTALDEAIDGISQPTEARVARDVGRVLGEGGVLVAGSSMPIRDLDRYLGPGPARIISNRGASGIDGLVSTALGASTVEPVVGLMGDLSFLHDVNGLLVRPRPPCVLVVVDNDGGGIFSFLPQVEERDLFERVFGTPTGMDIEELAATHQLRYSRAQQPADISSKIELAIAASAVDGQTHIVHVPVDRQTHVETARALTSDVCVAVERSIASSFIT